MTNAIVYLCSAIGGIIIFTSIAKLSVIYETTGTIDQWNAILLVIGFAVLFYGLRTRYIDYKNKGHFDK
ncbi:MAG: hypothetical protein ACTTJS_08475 [Wolinella sp.]